MTEDDDARAPSRPAGRPVLRRLWPVAALALGLAAFLGLGLDEHVTLAALQENRGALAAWVERMGVAGGIVFAACYALAVAFSIPGGLVLTIAGGFLFGPFAGTLYTVLGATTGATLLFLAARYALADALRGKVGGAIDKMEAGFNRHPMSYMLILRLVPVFPFWLVNLVPAFLGVPLRVYAAGTVLGIVPATFVYALLGDGAGAALDAGGDLDLGMIFQPRFLAPILGLAVLAAIPVVHGGLRRRRGGGA